MFVTRTPHTKKNQHEPTTHILGGEGFDRRPRRGPSRRWAITRVESRQRTRGSIADCGTKSRAILCGTWIGDRGWWIGGGGAFSIHNPPSTIYYLRLHEDPVRWGRS